MRNVRSLFLLSFFFIEIRFLFVAMRNIIFSSLLKTPSNQRPIVINKRNRNSLSSNEHVKAHFTPIIELKPILGGLTSIDPTMNNESIRKVTKIISANTIQKDSPQINTVVSLINNQSDFILSLFSRLPKRSLLVLFVS
jgi:hypothetical protein